MMARMAALRHLRRLGARTRGDAALGEQLHRAARDHDRDVHGPDPVLELHRRLHRLSVVFDRRVLRARLLRGRAVAAGRRADGAGVGNRDARRRRVRGRRSGAIILRLRGHYFAIGSIGVVEVVRLVISSWGSFTGGGDGLNLPLLSGGPDAVARIFLAVMIVIMIVVFHRHRRGRPQPARIRPALHSTERRRRQHGRRRHHALQGDRLYAVGAVLRDRRCGLRLLDRLYRPERLLLDHHDHQGAGHVPARRAGHRAGSGRSAPPHSRCWKRSSGPTSSITTEPFSAPSSSS